eukprot:6904616-Ditylum_brightwellii.AAC.2
MCHLLYIDDLKLYTYDEEEALKFKLLIQKYSDDTGMSYGLDKCTLFIMYNGKVVPIELKDGIPHLDEEKRHKYLGILESSDFLTQK